MASIQTIPFDAIDEGWDNFFEENEDNIQKRIDGMAEKQQLLMVYLMTIGEDMMTEDEQESLFAYGAFAWFMLDKHGCHAEVTESVLDEVESGYAEMLEDLEQQAPEEYVKKINEILKTHNQGIMLNYLLDVLDTEVEEGVTGEENAGMMFTILQVTIDCLLKAQKGSLNGAA
ncbi:MAG: hypothetical protein AB8F95_14620 [Bacteroidia bacterium]